MAQEAGPVVISVHRPADSTCWDVTVDCPGGYHGAFADIDQAGGRVLELIRALGSAVVTYQDDNSLTARRARAQAADA